MERVYGWEEVEYQLSSGLGLTELAELASNGADSTYDSSLLWNAIDRDPISCDIDDNM